MTAPQASMGFYKLSLLCCPFPPAGMCVLGICGPLHGISEGVNKSTHISICVIWRLVTMISTTVDQKTWVNVWIPPAHACMRTYIGIISVWVFNVSPLRSSSDEVSPRMEWLPRKRKRGRTHLQHDWLLSPPSPLFISTTISGIFINPHGSMCLGVVKIDKWLIRIPPFYFPTD